MERNARKEMKRQHAAFEATSNQAAAEQSDADERAHEAAMTANLAQHAMAPFLAPGATIEDAIAAKYAASAAAMGEERSAIIRE